MSNRHEIWSITYERQAITLLFLGFGLVGMDRFMVMPLFPSMMKDLGLTYQDLGLITGALSVAWGVSALFTGNLSDRIGRRKVLVAALVGFSILSALSGFMSGLGALLLVRGLIGVSEGAYTPSSIAATVEASKPNRRGLNLGIQQAALPLFGLGLAPLIATQLLSVMSWRWIFAVVSLPGFIVALGMYKVLRKDAPSDSPAASADARDHQWTHVFRYRNVSLAILGQLAWLTCLIVLTALFPNYLVDYLHLEVQQMGFVLSAIGFGAVIGDLILPGLSDRFGRKWVVVGAAASQILFVVLLMQAPANAAVLFGLTFMVSLFNFGLITLTVGPLSADSVPASLMSTASGFVIGIGEIFGGGIAPIIAGFVAHHYGIQYIFYLALGGLAIGLLAALSLVETSSRQKSFEVLARQTTD
jgi:MFS family permease